MIDCSGAKVRRLADEDDLIDVRLPLDFAEALYAISDEML